jgi:hypothetical protein
LVFKSSNLREGRFYCQSEYENDLLKNFGMENAKSIGKYMPTNGHLDLDEEHFGSRHFY